jgi:hypothetical protein
LLSPQGTRPEECLHMTPNGQTDWGDAKGHSVSGMPRRRAPSRLEAVRLSGNPRRWRDCGLVELPLPPARQLRARPSLPRPCLDGAGCRWVLRLPSWATSRVVERLFPEHPPKSPSSSLGSRTSRLTNRRERPSASPLRVLPDLPPVEQRPAGAVPARWDRIAAAFAEATGFP